MGNTTGGRNRTAARSAAARCTAALVGLSAGLSFWAMPAMAQAQSATSVSQSADPCRVFTTDGAGAGQHELTVECNGHGMMLGPVSTFSEINNAALQAILIDARLGGDRRILLLSAQDDGRPLVEDLGGEIALAAGRGPMSGTDGIDLDPARFASTGQIGVHGRLEDNGSEKAESIDISVQIAAERSRRHGVAAQN